MSGRAGIYKGPNGEELYGDGREVEVGSSTMSNAPDIPSDEAMWAVMSPASTIPAPLPLPADLDYLRGEIKIHVANLAKLREERDRARDALRGFVDGVINKCVDGRLTMNVSFEAFKCAEAIVYPAAANRAEGRP